MERPYIGVTGAASSKEVSHLVKTFTNAGFNLESSYLPMVGFLVSQKTLGGLPGNLRYPPIENLTSLLEATKGLTFNTIHYNFSRGSGEVIPKAQSDPTLTHQIAALFNRGIYADNLCRALQLNIVWPAPDQLLRIKNLLPELKIILQLSERCLVDPPPQVVDKLGVYEDQIQYALLDPSGGKGQVFSARTILPYYEKVKSVYPEITIGFGGGFTGENLVPRSSELVKEIGNKGFSLDAEGGLRDKLNKDYGNDLYNPKKVRHYIKQAAKFFLK